MNEGESTQQENDDIEGKATALANRVDIAQQAGDQEALVKLANEVQNDSQIMDALENRGANGGENQESKQDISKIQQAINELGGKFTKIVQLANEAMDRGAVTEGLFNNESERHLVVEKVIALVESVQSAATAQQAAEAVNIFSEWYQRNQPILADRTWAKVGYFGGSLPDGLLAQVRMFDSLQSDIDNAKHYLKLAEE